jgi:predicted lipoprotein with Yx(FWY)xxD motif
MKRRPVISVVLILSALVALGACSSSSKSGSTATTLGTNPSAPSTTTPSVTTPPAAKATLTAQTNAKLGKQIIVDAAGKTVYLYVPDGASTTSKVPAALKAAWPPVVASGAVIAGTGLTAAKLASDRQGDGSQQVAYNGHLLYTFANDKAPGDATGQGLGGIWFALTPAGDKAS